MRRLLGNLVPVIVGPRMRSQSFDAPPPAPPFHPAYVWLNDKSSLRDAT